MALSRQSKRVGLSILAAVCLLVLAAAPAQALYYPSGPQTFVPKDQLDGWQLCFSDLYGATESLDNVLGPCNQDLLLLAGGPTDSPTFTVLAAAPRADVIFDTGESNTPHNANGTGWYFNANWSWGFAKEGDAINRDECDVVADQDPGPNPDLRLCWHTLGGNGSLSGGYRAGAAVDLNDSTDYTRYVYQAPRPSNSFSVRVSGKQLLVTVSASGSVSVTDAAAPLSASASKKKKRRLRLNPSSASGSPPTISIPLRLTKLAKQKLRQKGKVTVNGRITFTPQGGLANAQTVKLKIKGKRKKR
jgi:hypothetical protein